NPYGRIYSLYKFLKFSWRNWPGSSIMDGFHSLEDFLTSAFSLSAVSQDTTGPDNIHRLFRSQAFWLCDSDGRVLLDHVARLERIESDFDRICSRIGVPAPERELDRANVSGAPDRLAALRNRILMKLGLKRNVSHAARRSHPSLEQAF